ncbi:hypothetical protein BP6252_02874 [Coleophoma cylindrospora]|uniref:Uncharacterized protein n=1 Tax=Coleophoma cylindrospora TaxID=1849047 RepID=A0A3D8SGL1_9HELO|nr:hypothetical protein BP6252_02874 [Coleophoma cylindrospora]
MSMPVCRVVKGLKPHVHPFAKVSTTSPIIKKQPWKEFWPPNAHGYSEEEKKTMPWLTWKFDEKNPTDRPWRQWMLQNQGTVVRRGAW